MQDEREVQPRLVSEYINDTKFSGDIPPYPIEKEQELVEAIRDKDKRKSARILNEILGAIFFSSGGKFEIIRARAIELVVLLSRAAINGGADTVMILSLNYMYINEVHKIRSLDEITQWLSKVMIRYMDNMFTPSYIKHSNALYKVTDYINNNYMKKITLRDMAGLTGLSDSYLGRIFNAEMKCSFRTYINEIRVYKSRALLLNGDDDMVVISELVGFSDQSYFNRVFKNITGMTPACFRRTRGRG